VLESPEDIAAYIEAAFEDGDRSVITHALGVAARAKGMSQLARDSGLSREALFSAFSKRWE
jgi:probable addiction module antidote protein